MNRIAVLVDELDKRLGRLTVPPSCFVIQHDGRTFVRTDKGVKLHHSHRAVAVVFEETTPYVRARLDPL